MVSLELSSDGGLQAVAQRSLSDVEIELREMRLSLSMEIEKRKLAEEALQSMQQQWQILREKLGAVGLVLVPADLTALGEEIGLHTSLLLQFRSVWKALPGDSDPLRFQELCGPPTRSQLNLIAFKICFYGIKEDDRMIQAEGIESLSEAEFRQACRERAARLVGLIAQSFYSIISSNSFRPSMCLEKSSLRKLWRLHFSRCQMRLLILSGYHLCLLKIQFQKGGKSESSLKCRKK